MEAVKQTIPIKDVLNLFYAREYAYDILRRFFIEEPSKDYVKQFVQRNMIDLFPFQEEYEEISAAVKLIKQFVTEHDLVNSERQFEDLHWDYTKLFIGPFEIMAAPWESTYVQKDKLLFQKTTMDVRSLYDKYGFQTTDFNIEADDHIGLELDFVYRLNELCIRSGEEDNEHSLAEIMYLLREQYIFINNHLATFVPLFANNVICYADTDFYRGLARILIHFIQIDLKVLQELLNIKIIKIAKN